MKSFTGMKKKWIVWIVCILISCMTFSVCASENIMNNEKNSLLSGYILDNKLYAFFEAGEPAAAELLIGDVRYAESYTEALAESDQYVHYYILLDVSGTVRKSKNQIREFVMELMKETKTKTLVTIMTLGDSFNEIIAASMEDDAVEKALNQISYNDQNTNLYKGIHSALCYIDEKERRRGDLYRLILVTDGEPDGESDTPSPEEVKKLVEARTDIVFDVIGVGNWKKGNEESLPMTGHDINIVSNLSQADDTAAKLAEETDCLYTVCFELVNPQQNPLKDIIIFLKGNEKRILEQQSLTVPGKRSANPASGNPEEETGETDTSPEQESGEADTSPEQESGEADTSPERETGEADTSPEQESGEADTSPEQESTDETKPEHGSVSDHGGQKPDTNAAITENATRQKLTKNLPLYVGIMAGCIVLCATAILLPGKLSRRKGKIAPNHLRVEVLSGQYLSRKNDFSLEHTLIIGSEKTCDIIWKEEDVAGQNTRIFVHEGIVCIEDLNSPCGTIIGGMRIFSPNRLRSGDIVCIGNCVQFRVFFNQQKTLASQPKTGQV